jgi:SRSO17 transposase
MRVKLVKWQELHRPAADPRKKTLRGLRSRLTRIENTLEKYCKWYRKGFQSKKKRLEWIEYFEHWVKSSQKRGKR